MKVDSLQSETSNAAHTVIKNINFSDEESKTTEIQKTLNSVSNTMKNNITRIFENSQEVN